MAAIYYIELTNKQVDEINATGWGGDLGRNYLNAKDGCINENTIGMFKLAATMNADEPETCWLAMQNGAPGNPPRWTDNADITCYTDSPRSMDVGDIAIVNGTAWRCDSCGWYEVDFEPVSDMMAQLA